MSGKCYTLAQPSYHAVPLMPSSGTSLTTASSLGYHRALAFPSLRWHCPSDHNVIHDVHVFCDAYERAYGSVTYLRSKESHGHINRPFLVARSRVAPQTQHFFPRLERCAAVTRAQLAKLLRTELSLPIRLVTSSEDWRYINLESNPNDPDSR